MNSYQKILALVVCMAALPLAVGLQRAADQPKPAPAQDGVLIHLSKGAADPHAVAMALKMANLMAADRDVLVYCDLQGISIVLKDGPDIAFPTFDSSRAQLKTLLDKSVVVCACPSCLKALGKTPQDLRPGVKTANKDAFFTFTKGRVVTLDY